MAPNAMIAHVSDRLPVVASRKNQPSGTGINAESSTASA